MEELVKIPITDTLDLHTFRPPEIRDLLKEYLAECRAKNILEIRIIHGKGRGILRDTVHALLSKLPEVISFRLAGEEVGGWGATLVTLKPL